MAGPSVVVRILGDTKALSQSINDTQKAVGGFKQTALGVGKGLAAGFAAVKVADFGKDAINAASDLSETMSKSQVVFGQSGKAVQDWSKNSATAMGLSRQAALEAAATYGNLAVSLGLPKTQAAQMSTKLVGLAGDLASFNNASPEETLQALQSGLVGETEPLRKFGINLNDAALRAESVKLHLSDGKSVLTASAKAQSAYALILAQSTTAQGDFARTSGGLANQQRIAKAQFENLKATVGQALLPVMVKLAGVLTKDVAPILRIVAGFLKDNAGWIIPLVGIIGTLVAALKIWTAVQAALDLVLAANPLVLLGLAIAAVIAGIVFLATKTQFFQTVWKDIQKLFEATWNWIKTYWPLLLAILLGPIGLAIGWIVQNWDKVKAAFAAVVNWLKANWPLLLAILTGPIGVAVLLIVKNWDKIKDAAKSVFDFIKRIWNDIVGFFTKLPGQIARLATNIWKGFANAFISAINAIIGAWNRLKFTIGGQKLPFGLGHFPGFTLNTPNIPEIPKLAQGGLITQTGLIYAHAGEAITPAPALGAGVQFTGPITVNEPVDAELLAKKIEFALNAGLAF